MQKARGERLVSDVLSQAPEAFAPSRDGWVMLHLLPGQWTRTGAGIRQSHVGELSFCPLGAILSCS